MIDEIRERIRNKEQFIYNVKCMPIPSSTAITAKNICMDEVAFLQEVLKKMERLQKKLEATEQVLAELIVKGERHRCSGSREGEKFFDPLEQREVVQRLTEIDDEQSGIRGDERLHRRGA